MSKVMLKLLLAFLFLMDNTDLMGQDTKCYPVKYLDFFGLEDMKPVRFSLETIEESLTMDLTKPVSQLTPDTSVHTNIIIPFIVYQLESLHPACNPAIDSSYLDKLFAIFCRVRWLDFNNYSIFSPEEKIDFMREDYYKQAEDDRILPYMLFTIDNGPFQGIDFLEKSKLDSIQEFATTFGKILTAVFDSYSIIAAYSTEDELLWMKKMTGQDNTKIENLTYRGVEHNNSLCQILLFYSGEKKLTLFLKYDGRFMFYLYEW